MNDAMTRYDAKNLYALHACTRRRQNRVRRHNASLRHSVGPTRGDFAEPGLAAPKRRGARCWGPSLPLSKSLRRRAPRSGVWTSDGSIWQRTRKISSAVSVKFDRSSQSLLPATNLPGHPLALLRRGTWNLGTEVGPALMATIADRAPRIGSAARIGADHRDRRHGAVGAFQGWQSKAPPGRELTGPGGVLDHDHNSVGIGSATASQHQGAAGIAGSNTRKTNPPVARRVSQLCSRLLDGGTHRPAIQQTPRFPNRSHHGRLA